MTLFVCLLFIINGFIPHIFFFGETKIHSPAMINEHHPGLAGSAEAAGEATSEEVGKSSENRGEIVGKSWGKSWGKGNGGKMS